MRVLGRVLKLVLRIKAFLLRLVAAVRWVKRGLRMLWTCRPKRLALLKLFVLMLAVAILSTASDFCPALTSTPKISAEWILPWWAGYHIGEPFRATLQITSPVALFVDPDSLRGEGETLGNFEIRRRAGPYVYYIKEETEVRKITEFEFTLQYLKPLGEGVFTKRALPRTYFGYRYFRQYLSGVYWVEGKADAERVELYITKRVRPEDIQASGGGPFYGLAGEVPEGRHFGWLLKAFGVVVVLSVPVYHLARFIYAWRSRSKPVPPEPEIYPGDKIKELLNLWWQTGDYCYFLLAAIWARIWAKQLLGLKPGELFPYHNDRCRCSGCRLWRVTTFALYSGKRLPGSEVWEGFVLFFRLEPLKKDSEPLPMLSRSRRIVHRIRQRIGSLKGGKDEV